MPGPATPGTQGPSFAPPQLPPGWIAQWDGASQKYYYVQLATGVSQWEIPTEAAKTGTTPAQPQDHPYGAPNPELITHPDGSQTVKHADGTLEPIMPDGSRGVDGPTGDRGLGTQAMNALLGGKNSGHGGGGSLGNLASGFLGGGNGHGGGGKNSIGGKLVGQLASNLFSPSQKPEAPQNYHGGQSTPSHNSGGLAGAVMGQVAHMFGGKESASGNNYGYSGAGTSGTYSGEAPTYNPTATPAHPQSSHQPTHQTNQHTSSQGNHNYSAPPSHGTPSHTTPSHNSQYPPAYSGHSPSGQQHGGGGYSQQPSYGGPQHDTPQHGMQHNQYPPPPPPQGGYNASYQSGGGGYSSPPQYGAPQGYPNASYQNQAHGSYGGHY